MNGNRFNMKGLSWFGFETSNYNLYGLDYHDMDWYFDWMLDHVEYLYTVLSHLSLIIISCEII